MCEHQAQQARQINTWGSYSTLGMQSNLTAQDVWIANRHNELANAAAERDAMTEKDPAGIDQHAPGAKLDQGKPRAALVIGGFARALMEVSKVGTFGANKYTDNGWKEVPNAEARYRDAGVRHLLYRMAGAEIDPDSHLSHLAHQAWNVLAELEFYCQSRDPESRNSGEIQEATNLEGGESLA